MTSVPPAQKRSAYPGSAGDRFVAYAVVSVIIALAYVIAFHGKQASWIDANGNPVVVPR